MKKAFFVSFLFLLPCTALAMTIDPTYPGQKFPTQESKGFPPEECSEFVVSTRAETLHSCSNASEYLYVFDHTVSYPGLGALREHVFIKIDVITFGVFGALLVSIPLLNTRTRNKIVKVLRKKVW